nr:hypothetical protein [Tanacetum cinerariifolium]
MSSYNHFGCSCCGGPFNGDNCPGCSSVGSRNEFDYDPNPNSFDNTPYFSYQSPQPHYETYSYELCGNDAHYDDDEEFSILMSEIYKSSITKITPDLPITDSLIIEDVHLDTIPKTKSDKLIKSSVEDLVPNPSESKGLSEGLSDIESECDVPVCDDFTTYSNLLFNSDNNFSSSDDESFSNDDVPKKIYSNLVFDEDIISIKIDSHHFNIESNLIESLLNQDSLIISSPKIDSLLEEFFGELAHIDLIPPGINEVDFDSEEEIRLVEKLLYDNSSPHDSIPPGIKNDDYDSEGDILFLEELLSNDSPSIPKNESFHFDVPSSTLPPAKPPDDGIYFEPEMGVLTVKVVGDISEHYVLMPRLLPTQPILASNEEKSPHLLSHQGFKAFQLSFESPMMIYGGDIPTLDVPFLHFYPP